MRRAPRGVAVILASCLTASAWAQAPASLPASPPAPDADAARVDEFVAASKFTGKRLDGQNQPVWTITRRGESLREFDVVFMVKNGILVTFVTVAPKASLRRTPELLEKMLKMNYAYDSVKIGFDEDDDAYVRMDARLRLLDAQEFTQIIEHVSTVAEALHKELKPFRIKAQLRLR